MFKEILITKILDGDYINRALIEKMRMSKINLEYLYRLKEEFNDLAKKKKAKTVKTYEVDLKEELVLPPPQYNVNGAIFSILELKELIPSPYLGEYEKLSHYNKALDTLFHEHIIYCKSIQRNEYKDYYEKFFRGCQSYVDVRERLGKRNRKVINYEMSDKKVFFVDDVNTSIKQVTMLLSKEKDNLINSTRDFKNFSEMLRVNIGNLRSEKRFSYNSVLKEYYMMILESCFYMQTFYINMINKILELGASILKEAIQNLKGEK